MSQLRAAVRLCRLRSDGDGETAGAQLRAVYNTFTEGFTTADLTEARALLEADPWTAVDQSEGVAGQNCRLWWLASGR
jgi:hypothetical protein